MPSFIKTETHISIVFDDGHPATVYSSSSHYQAVIAAVKAGDWEQVRDLACPINVVKKQVASLGERVTVEHGYVCLDGTPIHNTLTKRMLSMRADGFDIAPMSKFLENLMDNPSYRAVTELYDFLEASNLPITEDGHFLAYKRVNGDFTDCYTGTMDNSPGKIVSMPRNQVNEDKDQTCSTGLHFCSRGYLPHYGATRDSRVVMVKINPRDVVSIPSDYNNAKGRCCQYEVVRDLPLEMEKGSGYVPTEKLEGTFYNTNPQPSLDRDMTVVKLSNGVPVARYTSPTEAQRLTGVDASSIVKVCLGERNTAGGFVWRWVNPIKQNTIPNSKYVEDDCDYCEDDDDEYFDDGWYRR